MASIKEIALNELQIPDIQRIWNEQGFVNLDIGGVHIGRWIGDRLSAFQLRALERLPDYRLLRTELFELFAMGGLVADSELLTISRRKPFRESDDRIRWIALSTAVTAKGVDHVDRSLYRFRDRLRTFGRSARAFIAERECISAYSIGKVVHCVGSVPKHRLARDIQEVGVPEDVANFTIFGDGGEGRCAGGDKNCILLLTAGTCGLFCDDEIPDAFVSGDHARGGLCLQAAPCRPELLRRQSVIPAKPRKQVDPTVDLDLIGLHEKFLGKSINSLLSRFVDDDRLRLSGACPHMISSIIRQKAHVAATVLNFAMRDSANQIQLCAPPEPTIIHDPPVMAHSFAVDARSLIPPFAPCAVDSHRVFFLLLSRCCVDSFYCHLPHCPTQSSLLSADESVTRVTMSELLLASIAAAPDPIAQDPAGRLREVGQFLLAIASQEESELKEWMLLRLLGDGRLRRRYDQDWRNVINRKSRSRPTTSSRETQVISLHDFGNANILPTSDYVRKVLMQFGYLLTLWPTIFNWARSRNKEQDGIST
jgi:hypothetical protein